MNMTLDTPVPVSTPAPPPLDQNALALKVAEWRRKCNDGSITDGEMREALAMLRAQRTAAAVSSEKARAARTTRAAKKDGAAAVDTEGLLKELGI